MPAGIALRSSGRLSPFCASAGAPGGRGGKKLLRIRIAAAMMQTTMMATLAAVSSLDFSMASS